MMVENFSRRIQFGFIMMVVGDSFVVWVMVIPTCSDCDQVQVVDVDVGNFSE